MMQEPGLAAALLPPGCAAADIADTGQDIALRPAEAVLLEKAGEKRRRDFTLGRHCAHLALARLGHAAQTIGRGPRGEPLWPPGVGGSITHTRGYAAAIAAPADMPLGVDAEHIGGVTPGLWPKLFGTEEQAMLARLDAGARAEVATAFFTAKEAHYKAVGGVLRFPALRVTLNGHAITVMQDNGVARSEGAYILRDGLLVTLVRRIG